MTENNFHFKEHQINYYTYGSGEKVMLAFHGFGQNGRAFGPMANIIGKEFTIYSFDLFFHGNSYWSHEDTPLSKAIWAEIITAFLASLKIKEVALMGFSIGAKFVLATLEAIPERIIELIFIAPDGIKPNIWYQLATSPIGLKKVFKSMIQKPQLFFSILRTAEKLKFIDRSLSKFAASQMDSLEKRKRVYYSWIVFSHLKFKMKKISHLLTKNHIPVTFYLGTLDKVITPQHMQPLIKKITDYKIVLIKSAHNHLIHKVSEHISS
ncbi:alpha/beta hydrolase [Fulvivirga maritima]|uniref:alpha/beta fold hydrolase n=1 Tax=Fulvivirga maritima TaxID=2904247 RepID=UPI001F3D81A6|nr:alpha/beta hydrolase [Fulvivirga maritima]UII29420.1 alpha/beta hydrolase [Fulvivirga maritima]